jgi:hypothetical protein
VAVAGDGGCFGADVAQCDDVGRHTGGCVAVAGRLWLGVWLWQRGSGSVAVAGDCGCFGTRMSENGALLIGVAVAGWLEIAVVLVLE